MPIIGENCFVNSFRSQTCHIGCCSPRTGQLECFCSRLTRIEQKSKAQLNKELITSP